MATFTSLGVGSGLDLNTMVQKLVALERAPLVQLKRDATKLDTQVSSFGKMQSMFSALQDASNALTSGTLWAGANATSSDDSAVSASGGGGAAAGRYAVTVTALASSQTLSSGTVFASPAALVGAGTMSIDVGSWDATRSSFDSNGAAPIDIAVDSSDTVQSLRDKINGAGAGVTATLVTDASGTRLALRSSETGAAHGFRVSVTDGDGVHNDADGLSRLAYDPPSGATGMVHKQAAANAIATVNGITVESQTNELSGVVDGLTLRLRKVTDGDTVDVDVSRDTDAVITAVKSFAEAYNALASYIGDQTKYDATTKVGGALQGDSAVNSLQSQLRAVLATVSGASAAFPRLSDLGLQLTRAGTLKVDEAKLGAAVKDNLAEVKKAFSNSDTAHPANDGFARRYAQLASRVLDTSGSLATRTQGLKKLSDKNKAEQDKVDDRAERVQKRLVDQYTQMDTNLSKLNALSSYMTAQLAALTKSSS